MMKRYGSWFLFLGVLAVINGLQYFGYIDLGFWLF